MFWEDKSECKLKIIQSLFNGPSKLRLALASRNTRRFVVNVLIQCFQESLTALTVKVLSFHMTSAQIAREDVVIKDLGGSYIEGGDIELRSRCLFFFFAAFSTACM